MTAADRLGQLLELGVVRDVERLEPLEVWKDGLRQFLQQVVAHVQALQQLQLAQPFRKLLQLVVLDVENLV